VGSAAVNPADQPEGPGGFLSDAVGTVPLKVSTATRRRAESYIRRAVTAGWGPWEALDGFRRRGGRIGWREWFSLWRRVAAESGLRTL